MPSMNPAAIPMLEVTEVMKDEESAKPDPGWFIRGVIICYYMLYIPWLYPQKVNFVDTLQLDNLENLDNLGVDESKVDAVAGSMLDKLFDVWRIAS